jgi:antitoxin component YwqK of YwqJK toxin-antitoxin module
LIWKEGNEWEGKSTLWWETGQKWEVKTWKDGKLDGLWTTYYENGQKRFEETYKDGKQIDSKYWKNESKEVIEKIGKKVEEKIDE